MTLELKRPDLLCEAVLVGGRWIAADGNAIAVTNPTTGGGICYVPDLGAAETQEAIVAAEASQKAWAKRTARDRSAILGHWFDLMMTHQADLAAILTAEQGIPLSEATGEIAYGASFVEWFSEEARRAHGDVTPTNATDKRILTIKQPIGVTAVITPWNFPNAMMARKAAPAFAAGCAMVLKPSELTPFSAIAMATMAEEAGLPAGLFSVVTGDAATLGSVLTGSPTVRKLTYAGSTGVGAKLYEQCAPTIKKLGLELGGNAPFIVFDDADLYASVDGAILSKFRNNGQTCVCANRIYVQAGVYDAFAEKLPAKVSCLKVGSGADEGVVFGPLINETAMTKISGHIANATGKGASVILRGVPHVLGSTFYEPTIVTGVTSDMSVATEETLGPVAPLFRFETEAEVVTAANAPEFGLASYFYSQDIARVWRVSEALEYGIVGVNAGYVSTTVAPFGGVKFSGLGREGARQGLDDYLETKYICMGGIDPAGEE